MKYILHAYDEAFYLFIIYKKFVIRNSAIPDSSKDKWQKRKNTKKRKFLLVSPNRVSHILVEWTDFNDIRNKYFVACSTEELFKTVDVRNILYFIK